jgi:hypothetical protein
MRKNKRQYQTARFDFYSKQTIAIIIVFLLFIILNGCPGSRVTNEYTGEFLANDSGVSHGGFEWGSQYSASLVIRGTRGDLILTHEIGLGDYLRKHEFSISEFTEVAGNISFKIEGRAASLVLIEEDTIWNRQYNGYFTGNKTSDLSERIGYLPIEPFVGFNSRFYIDLRLLPEQPEPDLFGLIAGLD